MSETNNSHTTPTTTPLVDVYETEDEILVVADMPGARADSVEVKLEKDQLFISAKRSHGTGDGEVLYGAKADWDYNRTFLVPRGIDAAQITAEMSLGVLQVHLPRSAALKRRTITVNAGN